MTNYADPSIPMPDFPGPLFGGTAAEPQLDTEVTSEQVASLSQYRDFMVSGMTGKVAAARAAYEKAGTGSVENRLRVFDGCRTVAWFVRHSDSGKIRVASSRCGLRWCPLCIKTRRFAIVQAVANWMRPIVQPKFLTLTLKHNSDTLTNQINSLYAFWKELKRNAWFKKRVRGGVWFFQIKKSAKDGLWHPHLHILFQGRYLEHGMLSKIWSKITHGSKIVDVRAVNDKKKAVEYVARYASSPCELSDLDPEDAVECVSSLRSRRVCGVFGSAKGVRLRPTKPEDGDKWEKVGGFGLVMRDASFDDYSSEIVRAWRTGGYCPPPPFKLEEDVGERETVLAEVPHTYCQLFFGFMAG